MVIGICDDRREEREYLQALCEAYADNKKEICEYVLFSGGKEVLEYCMDSENSVIDLLFLDIEMSGMSGLELRAAVAKEEKIWRIAFVTSHMESVLDAYGIKTIGFVPKPPTYELVEKSIQIVAEELKENVTIEIVRDKDDVLQIELNDIVYLKAAGSYTEIYTYDALQKNESYILSAKKLGDIEKKLSGLSIVRVHKSYLVNLEHVLDAEKSVKLRDIEDELPVGRNYKETVKTRVREYAKGKIRRRL